MSNKQTSKGVSEALGDFELPNRKEPKNSSNAKRTEDTLGSTQHDFDTPVRSSAKTREILLSQNQASAAPKDTELTCPKCAATKIAKSRSKGLDSLIIRFIPMRPYRCLRCYNRFWNRESFFANSSRLLNWVLIALIIALSITLLMQTTDTKTASNRSSAASIVKETHELPPDELKLAANNSKDMAAETKSLAKNLQSSPAITATSHDNSPQDDSQFRPNLEPSSSLSADSKTITPDSAKQPKSEALTLNAVEKAALVRAELSHQVEQWRRAWEQADIDRYFSHYSNNFIPISNASLGEWRALRRNRISKGKKIQIQLSNFEVKLSPQLDSADVIFTQHYQSRNYVDESRKLLSLQKTNGQWKIKTERQVTKQ